MQETRARFTINSPGGIGKGYHFGLEYHVACDGRHPIPCPRRNSGAWEAEGIQDGPWCHRYQQSFSFSYN